MPRRSDPRRRLLALARHRAKKKRLKFSIEIDDFVVPRYCPVLGIPLKPGKGRPHDGSPTLDRIDSTKGYVPGNVLVISNRANRTKNTASVAELLRVAAYYQQVTE